MRNLVLILGDQLDPAGSAFDGFDPDLDAVWMAEVEHEARHVPSHKARIVLFLAAMRHFRDDLRARSRWSTTANSTPTSTRRWRPRWRPTSSGCSPDA